MSVAEKQLSVVQGGAMPVLNVSNEQKLVAIRDTVAKGASDAEFTMLMHLANTYQLDPFLKEIWFIKYGSTPTIMVSRDGLRNYAQRQDDFEGMISQEVRKGDEFSYSPITKEIHHVTSDGSGEITKAYAIVYRAGRDPHIELVDFEEYYSALSGKNAVWKSHPSAMIKKVAEVLALKKCYTITGLYAPEEMGLQEPDNIPTSSVVPEYTMGDVVDDKQPPQQHRQPTKQDRIDALNQLFDFASPFGFDGDRLKEFGADVTGKPATKWTLEDIAHIRRAIEEDVAQREASGSEQSSLEFDGLPNDEDLPF